MQFYNRILRPLLVQCVEPDAETNRIPQRVVLHMRIVPHFSQSRPRWPAPRFSKSVSGPSLHPKDHDGSPPLKDANGVALHKLVIGRDVLHRIPKVATAQSPDVTGKPGNSTEANNG